MRNGNVSSNSKKERRQRNKALNRSVYNDWGLFTFIQMLTYKCLLFGKELVFLDEKYTSQECHFCQNRQEMPLYKRVYHCENCGLAMGRDESSAHNILARFLARLGPHTLEECGVLHESKNSVEVLEASCHAHVQQLELFTHVNIF